MKKMTNREKTPNPTVGRSSWYVVDSKYGPVEVFGERLAEETADIFTEPEESTALVTMAPASNGA